MKRYLKKTTYVAKKSNKLYEKGHVQIWYSGKNRQDQTLTDYVKEDGYVKKGFVENKIKKYKEFDDRFQSDFWEITYEIIEVEV